MATKRARVQEYLAHLPTTQTTAEWIVRTQQEIGFTVSFVTVAEIAGGVRTSFGWENTIYFSFADNSWIGLRGRGRAHRVWTGTGKFVDHLAADFTAKTAR